MTSVWGTRKTVLDGDALDGGVMGLADWAAFPGGAAQAATLDSCHGHAAFSKETHIVLRWNRSCT